MTKHENDNTPVGGKDIHFGYQPNKDGRFNIVVVLKGNILPAQFSMNTERAARILVDGFNITLEEEEKNRNRVVDE